MHTSETQSCTSSPYSTWGRASQLGIDRDCLGKVVGRRRWSLGKGKFASRPEPEWEKTTEGAHNAGKGIWEVQALKQIGREFLWGHFPVRKPSVTDGKQAWIQRTSCDSAVDKCSCSYWGFFYDCPVSSRYLCILVQKYYGIMNPDFYSYFNLLIKDYYREKSCLFCVETLDNFFSHCKMLLIRDLLAQKKGCGTILLLLASAAAQAQPLWLSPSHVL